jgi:hypothetical protein
MNQNELLETLSSTYLHLSKAAVALTKVVDDKSSEKPEAERRRADAKYYRSQILEVVSRLDERIKEVEEEECEFCDTKKSAPNFAYHFCTGRKAPKGSV